MRNRWMRYCLQEQAADGTEGGAAATTDNADAATVTADKVDTSTDSGTAASDVVAKATDADKAKGYWPDDWRDKASKGDEKLLKRFSRYASPEVALEALVAAQNRISSGELRTAFPKDGKSEDVAQWRKDNGIPEAPDKYDLKFDSGLVVGEADKPYIDEFLKEFHGQNLTNDQAKGVVEAYYKNQEKLSAQREEKDREEANTAIDALHAEWGGDFVANKQRVGNVLALFPDDVRDSLLGARMPDGKGVFNDPQIMRTFAAIDRMINPAGTLVPSGGGDPAKSVAEEITKIETTMRDNRPAYNKDEKMQARYRELLGAREQLQKR